ncbi:MAG: hypothetical protein ACAH89_07085 [Rariglobus sp.]|nr:hypothetical protein [Rariglobus sp.]
MKIQPRHITAAPFFAFSAYMLVEFLVGAPKLFLKGGYHITFAFIFIGILVFIVAVPGVLAIKRRWEDFIKVIGMFVAIAVFVLLSQHTSSLAKSTDDFIRADYPALGALWGTCVMISPWVICIVGYQRLVPLIVRRIYLKAPQV